MKKFQISSEDGKFLPTWIKNPNQSLFFVGDPGRGKTFAAKTIMDFLKNRKECEFWNMADLNQRWLASMNEYKENFYLLEHLKKIDFLILDDLGVRTPTEGFLDFFYSLINARIENPSVVTIFTTNLDSKELNKCFGPRMVSRIVSCKVIKFFGEDLRMNPISEEEEEKNKKLIQLFEQHKENILKEKL